MEERKIEDAGKKSYSLPVLTKYGNLATITKNGNTNTTDDNPKPGNQKTAP